MPSPSTCHAEVDLAAVNEPGSCVVAGPEEDIRAVQRTPHRTGHPRSSGPHLARVPFELDGFVLPEFTGIPVPPRRFASRRIPLLSNVTGTWMTADEATDPQRGPARYGPRSGSPTNSTRCSPIRTASSSRSGPAAP